MLSARRIFWCLIIVITNDVTDTAVALINKAYVFRPLHARHSIAVTVVMYHLTIGNWELDSSEIYRKQKNYLVAK